MIQPNTTINALWRVHEKARLNTRQSVLKGVGVNLSPGLLVEVLNFVRELHRNNISLEFE
jgi:hypothetical protein